MGINRHPQDNKTQKQNIKQQEKRDIQYNEIIKQIDANQTTFKKTLPPNTTIIDEKKGFGWKGLGSRMILLDNDRKEYLYEVIEPPLTEKQEQTKNKLITLFKKYADIDEYEGDTTQK